MNEHGFIDTINNYGNNNDNDNNDGGKCEFGNNNIDDDVSKSMDSQAVVKNGYTITHPKFTECTRLVTNNGLLLILNKGLDRIREELYQYQHNNNNNNNKKKHKSTGNRTQNTMISLPGVEKSRSYKKLNPANSPSLK